MTPKEIVQTSFEERVNPWLESLGFKYSKSQFEYKRKTGPFVQHISISLNRRNSSDSITFWSMFGVNSPYYKEWLTDNGKSNINDAIGGSCDWNIPGWRPEQTDSYFDFSVPNLREAVLKDWINRCKIAGIPYLDSISNWQGAAKNLLESRWLFGQAADFYLISGDIPSALSSLEAGINNYTVIGRKDNFGELPELIKRRDELVKSS